MDYPEKMSYSAWSYADTERVYYKPRQLGLEPDHQRLQTIIGGSPGSDISNQEVSLNRER